MATTAFKYIKEPPNGWEIEILKPALWRGRFTSVDGVTWWSPALERNLGLHHNNPGETAILETLRSIARNHRIADLEAVVSEARDLIEAWSTGRAIPDLFRLRRAIAVLDGRRPVLRNDEPLYVGDGHPAARARYEPDSEPEEFPQ